MAIILEHVAQAKPVPRFTSRKISFSDGRHACSPTTMPGERLTAPDPLSDTSALASMMKQLSLFATR